MANVDIPTLYVVKERIYMWLHRHNIIIDWIQDRQWREGDTGLDDQERDDNDGTLRLYMDHIHRRISNQARIG